MKYGFEHLVYEIPQHRESVQSLCNMAGFGMEMVNQIKANGLCSIPVNRDSGVEELINKAVRKLIALIPDLAERTEHIILAHSLPVLSENDTSVLKDSIDGLHMEEIPRIELSGMPCTILHMAIQMGRALLNDQRDDKGVLIIGADQALSPEDRIFFGSTMGDAAVAGFLNGATDKNIILSSITETEVIACDGELSQTEEIKKFREMNPLNIRHAVQTALAEAALDLSEIKYIVPHTANRLIWDTVAILLKYPREKILDIYIGETGHLNSNDSFCHYVRARNETIIRTGDKVLLINPGFGGTRGCTIIKA